MLKKKRKQRKEREKKVMKEKRALEDGENAMRWRGFSGLSRHSLLDGNSRRWCPPLARAKVKHV